jgi:hypothetical protein
MANRAHPKDNSQTHGVCVLHAWILLRLDTVYMLGFNQVMEILHRKSPPKISSPRKYLISFPGLVYVIIVVSFRIVMMSWFHSRENSLRFLQ